MLLCFGVSVLTGSLRVSGSKICDFDFFFLDFSEIGRFNRSLLVSRIGGW